MNGEHSDQTGLPETDSTQGLVQQISYPLYECRGWMKLVGVMYIINGVMLAITIVGILFAWLPIWIGVLVFQAATAAEEAYYNGSEYELTKSLSKLKTFFIIMGVMTLIGIIFFILFFFLGLAGSMFNFSRMFHMRY